MKNKGIVIKSLDYKESSKIVYLYTPIGKVSVKAIGANNPKKGLLGFISTGNIVSYVSTDSEFPNLLEYNLEQSIFGLTNSINSLDVLRVIIEVIEYIPEDTNHQSTYNFIESIIKELNIINPKKLLAIFLIKMLYVFGVSPMLRSCSICGSKDIIGFKISDGGAVCKYCRPSIKNKDTYDVWYEYYYGKKSFKEYRECDYDSLLNNINKYYLTHVHLNFKINNQ